MLRIEFITGEDSNLLDAAVNGASQSVFLIGNIAASLIAFLAFIAFLNGVLGWLGSLVSFPDLSFEFLLGWIFYPLAAVMGVPCGSRCMGIYIHPKEGWLKLRKIRTINGKDMSRQ